MSNLLSNKEAFLFLLELCKSLDIYVKFGLPKSKRSLGSYFYYNSKNKKSYIYIPKYYSTKHTPSNNLIMMHEIAHFILFKQYNFPNSKHEVIGGLLSVIEEIMAWKLALEMAQLFNIKIDQDAKTTLNSGINSYIDDLYNKIELYIVNILKILDAK